MSGGGPSINVDEARSAVDTMPAINLAVANKTTKTDKNYFVQIHVMNRVQGIRDAGYGCFRVQDLNLLGPINLNFSRSGFFLRHFHFQLCSNETTSILFVLNKLCFEGALELLLFS